jgi:hypothetical protein
LATPCLAVGLVVQVPGVGHHERKVIVIIDGSRHVVVVLFKFLLGHNVVRGLIVAHVVCSFESFKELKQDLLFCLLAADDIGVSLGRVDASDVVDVNVAIAVLIKFGESLSDVDLAGIVHWATNDTQELVVLNKATSVQIESFEKDGDLSITEAKHVVLHRLRELVLVQGH